MLLKQHFRYSGWNSIFRELHKNSMMFRKERFAYLRDIASVVYSIVWFS